MHISFKRLYCLVIATAIILTVGPATSETVQTRFGLVLTTSPNNPEVFQAELHRAYDSDSTFSLCVEKGGHYNYYELVPNEPPKAISFTYGAGRYALHLLRRIKNGEWQEVSSTSITSRSNSDRIWLISTCMIDYANSELIKDELAKVFADGKPSTTLGIYLAITNYVTDNYHYDFIRRGSIKKQNASIAYSALDETIGSKTGLCLEISQVAVALLRLAGIPAKLVIGDTGLRSKTSHAWVETTIDGVFYRYDFTAERYYSDYGEYYPKQYY